MTEPEHDATHEDRLLRVAGELLDERMRVAERVHDEMRFYRIRQWVLYVVLFIGGVIAAIVGQANDHKINVNAGRSLAAQREGCGRLNVIREEFARKTRDDVQSAGKTLGSRKLGPELSQFRKEIDDSLARDRRTLRRLRRSVDIPVKGHRYRLNCVAAYRAHDLPLPPED